MTQSSDIRETAIYVVIAIVTYLVLQAATIVAHEFVHSTAAWLLGYTPSAFSVVWGNPITMRGWDEGVPYDKLFPSTGNPAQALIRGAPLVFHAIVVSVGLFLLQRPWMTKQEMVVSHSLLVRRDQFDGTDLLYCDPAVRAGR